MSKTFSPFLREVLRGLLLILVIILILISPDKFSSHASAQSAGAWVHATSMNVARNQHSATLLSDGRILVAGGRTALFQGLKSSEIYDPATDRWTPTGDLNEARFSHAAVLLKDGRVLLVGRQSAEVFNPATGKWSQTGPMELTPSQSAAAYESVPVTLLADGKVLVTGGRSGSLSFARGGAELFDPTTNNWTTIKPMNFARQFHSATLLPNGKVLIAGGINRTDAPTAAELFDPATGQWALTGVLRTSHAGHLAALLPNGRVLIASGSGDGTSRMAEMYDPATGSWGYAPSLNFSHSFQSAAQALPNSKFMFADSRSEVYDFATGRWSVIANPALPRQAPLVALPNGKVLLIGGSNGENSLRDVEQFDPVASPAVGVWNLAQQYGGGRELTATVFADGRVLVAGGAIPSFISTTPTVQNKTQIFSTASGWQLAGNLNTARYRHSATLLPNGQVLVAGGESATFSSLLSAELYNPATNTWRAAAPLSLPRRLHQAVLLTNGKVLLAGGASDIGDMGSAELYDATMDRWATTGSMSIARRYHTLILLADGKVLATGGETNGAATSSAELYDPVTGMWKATGSLKTARRRHTATRLLNGKVLVTGGDNNGVLASSEIYDPATGQWTSVSALNFARQNHTATLLDDGNVLIAAGADGDGRLQSAELFDPTSNNGAGTILRTSWMKTRRELHSATKLPDGRVLVIGGINGMLDGSVLKEQPAFEVELFDPKLTDTPSSPIRITPVSASSFQGGDLAADSIIAIFGERFSNVTAAATANPLPVTLAGARVSITQSGGNFPMPLFFVSPNQINCQLLNVVTGAAPRGAITLTVTTSDGATISEPVYVVPVMPSLFSADSTGKGLAAAVVLRIKANGEQVYESVSRFDSAQNRIVPVPIDLSNANEQAFLILYGTGWRNRSSLAAVTASVGGIATEVIYAGQQGDFVGLDQANLRLPMSLAGRGEVEVRLTVDGIEANPVTVVIK
ncbi:MAG TPA: kelch repeat-containing protein [Blastocatellia bacterium]|nr:kelch repeat-containing protein [Blastocatellia bacterium]